MHAKNAIDYLDWSSNSQWLGISVSNVGVMHNIKEIRQEVNMNLSQNMMIDIRKKKR